MLSSIEVISCDNVVDQPKTCAYLMHQMLRDPDAVVNNVEAQASKWFL